MKVAERHAARQERLTRRMTVTALREWATLDPADLSYSWRRVGPRLVAVLTAGQTAAAADASDYIDAAVRAQGVDPEPEGRVVPEAFAGRAADGRPLDTLMLRTLITTKESIGRGLSVQEALGVGGRLMSMYMATEIGDAGRSAEGVGMHATRRVTDYTRVLGGKGCARCAILAGQLYHKDVAFLRHPNCKCRNVPVAQGGSHPPRTTDASAYFHGLSRADQNRLFTVGGARAIRDGADINAVVNARRGVYAAVDGSGRRARATYEGTTRRGLYHQMQRARAYRAGTASPRNPRGFSLSGPRLLPEQIYADATSHSEAIALLRQYGYLGWAP